MSAGNNVTQKVSSRPFQTQKWVNELDLGADLYKPNECSTGFFLSRSICLD